MFRLRDLSYAYRREPEPALAGLSMDLPLGGRVALLGPSGSGKTTLLNLLGLLLPVPRPNMLSLDALDLGTLAESERVRLRLTRFGYVLQSCYLLPNFTCQENVAMPLRLAGRPKGECSRRVEELLDRIGDANLRKAVLRRGGEVSVGQRQRVAVLRSVVHDPETVFADEPTSNLDPAATRATLKLLADWHGGKLGGARPGRTLMLVCHHLETALDVLAGSGTVAVIGKSEPPLVFPAARWADHASEVNRRLGARVPADYQPQLL